MNKIEFINEIKCRLSNYPEEEIDKAMSFYVESIEDRVEDGMSEEEAVASLGNINDIVDKGIVSTLYPVFTVKNMDSYFLRTKLNEGNEFKRFALAQKQGGSRTYMYFSKLESLQMNIPSLEEQELILSCLDPIDKKIEINSMINNNLAA